MIGGQDPRLESAFAVASDKHARGRRLPKTEKLCRAEALGSQGRAGHWERQRALTSYAREACPRLAWPLPPPLAYLVLEMGELLAIPVHQRLRIRVQELRHACLLCCCAGCRCVCGWL